VPHFRAVRDGQLVQEVLRRVAILVDERKGLYSPSSTIQSNQHRSAKHKSFPFLGVVKSAQEALSKQRPFRYNKSYRIVFTLMFAVLFDKNNKLKEWVSLVIEINQKNQSTHFPKAMHYIYTHKILKELQSK
jgi:hypothetical protein